MRLGDSGPEAFLGAKPFGWDEGRFFEMFHCKWSQRKTHNTTTYARSIPFEYHNLMINDFIIWHLVSPPKTYDRRCVMWPGPHGDG